MDLATEFRIRAERCLALSREAATIESQTHWLGMAQLWYSLAQYAEDQDMMSLRHPRETVRFDANQLEQE
ncbi:MAG TPA: hypothetical protein VFK79_11490 [Xanthobacteraceae bacterium]|nr:hypothetical protein [Xanthobacteraceae bacterium]